MNHSRTHQDEAAEEELSIVHRILGQASFVLESPTLFDQLWTPAYLARSFQWTEHLQSIIKGNTRDDALRDDLDVDDDQEVDPKTTIARFLERSKAKGPSTIKVQGKDKELVPVTLEEMADPTNTLCSRLLHNPVISDRVRKEVVDFMVTNESRGIQTPVHTRATAQLLASIQSHMKQVPPPLQIVATIDEEELHHRAQAQAILERVRNAGSAIDQETTLRRLDEYLIQARSEAMAVIRQLMLITEEDKEEDKATVDVYLEAFRAALSARLQGYSKSK
ncbi:hypothetical protein EMPS_11324 [Entomortierella parvispora]|uniref:Uncharacterized protein n=1 Tax=Entomortierella parvispora TaxID=205924 RepID=A0A9P3HLV0_9FUNG|nr:hypothetical protein EMPS_11324 [Entomortierella parvispora]